MALGATKAKTIFTVVVPAAIAGLTSGMMLNLARVAGETAPLLFTALGNMFWSHGWLQPTATLPVMIYNYAISPEEDLHQQAWAAGFVLLTLVLVINVTARMIIARGPASSPGDKSWQAPQQQILNSRMAARALCKRNTESSASRASQSFSAKDLNFYLRILSGAARYQH